MSCYLSVWGLVHQDFMVENRDGFEPFIEDDEPFDKYMANMRKEAEWGGHLELQVACETRVGVVWMGRRAGA